MSRAPLYLFAAPSRRVGVSRAVGLNRSVGLSRIAGLDHPPNLAKARAYQVEGVYWLRDRTRRGENSLLGDDPGLGKTLQVLLALPDQPRAIIVCPASVVREWTVECSKWRPDVTALPWSDLRHPAPGEAVITSYDSLPEAGRAMSRLIVADLRDTILVLDEAHRVKSLTAKRSDKVSRLGAQCGAVWGLTGTPMKGTPEDLWGVLVSLGLATRAFKSRTEFKTLCGGQTIEVRDPRTGRPVKVQKWGSISPEVSERLSRVMLRRTRAQVRGQGADETSVIYRRIVVDTPKDLRPYLDRVSEEWDSLDQTVLPPFEMLSEAMMALAKSRTEAAIDLARDVCRECPTLFFSAHRYPVEEAARRLADSTDPIVGGMDDDARTRAILSFKSGERRVIPMTITAGGVGLNLPEAGAAIRVDREWSPSDNDQAVARMLRTGQTRDVVTVFDLVSDHPLDLRLEQIIQQKVLWNEEAGLGE